VLPKSLIKVLFSADHCT